MSIEKTHQKLFNLEYRAKIMYLKVTHFTFFNTCMYTYFHIPNMGQK